MDGLRFGQAENGKGSLRSRIIILVALPAAVLGAMYFLFVEYTIQNLRVADTEAATVLRAGGVILVVLALVLAMTCGWLLVERVGRPLKLLIRLIDSGEFASARAAMAHHREWEVLELYRRVSALLQQNRAGARAVEELEDLRAGVAALRQAVAQPAQHGVSPALDFVGEGALVEVARSLESNRARLLEFLVELGERMETLRSDTSRLGAELGFRDEPDAGALAPPVTGNGAGPGQDLDRAAVSLRRLRRVGTVLALESERLLPDAARRVGELKDRFEEDLSEVERGLEACRHLEGRGEPDRATGEREAELVWRRILEDLATLKRRLAEVESK